MQSNKTSVDIMISIFLKKESCKNPSPFIYPLESPVFIGVSGAEWHKSTLHYPSSPFILIG